MPVKRIGVLIVISVIFFFIGHPAMAAEKTYTNISDFAKGKLEGLNYDLTPDQLQLNATKISFKFVNVAATGRKIAGTTIDGTLIRIDAESGDIIGEYRTAPDGLKGGPSRTSVDSEGNVWVVNRNEAGSIGGTPHGSVVKIGIVVGGTRGKKQAAENADTFFTTPFDKGEYLEGPFDYNTCIDRDGDGLIKTSRGLEDVRPWPAGTDGLGGTGDDEDDATVTDADDECILVFQRVPGAGNAQHVSVDANDDVWVGGYPPNQYSIPDLSGNPAMFHKLDGDTGAIEESFNAGIFGCGGFGGLVDDNGILWSASLYQNKLLHYDPTDGSGGCINVAYSYGLAELVQELTDKTDVFIWNSSKWLPNQITKINAATLQIEEGFPKSTADAGDSMGFEDRGVAVTPQENHVWVVKAGAQTVRRLDSAGNLLDYSIPLVDPVSGESAREPNGIAVDGNGKIWVSNRGTNNVMRIDPSGNNGLGAVDLTVDLPGAGPYNYGDMAGEIELGTETASLGTWTVITDGDDLGTLWDTITWNNEKEGAEPVESSIAVEAQAADSTDDLNDDANYEKITNRELLSLTGRFIKIRVTLKPDSEGKSPILSDLVVTSLEETAGMICDVDENGSVDLFDILRILFTRGDAADQPFDLRDWDDDGTITSIDARGCVKACTRQFCIPVDL